MIKCIHYGADSYNPELVKKIENYDVKPHGGLWSCLDGTTVFSWKQHVYDIWGETGSTRDMTKAFKFSIADSANIVEINNMDDIRNKLSQYVTPEKRHFVDFEKMIDNGIDVLIVNLSKDHEFYPNIKFIFAGWDCDTVLIFNKDVIVLDDKGGI